MSDIFLKLYFIILLCLIDFECAPFFKDEKRMWPSCSGSREQKITAG